MARNTTRKIKLTVQADGTFDTASQLAVAKQQICRMQDEIENLNRTLEEVYYKDTEDQSKLKMAAKDLAAASERYRTGAGHMPNLLDELIEAERIINEF